jgi:hypothetical protein
MNEILSKPWCADRVASSFEILASASVPHHTMWEGFLLFAGLWILVAVVRGWIHGFWRQLLVPLGLVVAGFLVWNFTGTMAGIVIAALHFSWIPAVGTAIFILWFGGFNGVMIVGKLLFKRTRDYDFDLLRWLYGIGGALIGLVYGLATLWMIVMGIRLGGCIAAGQLAGGHGDNKDWTMSYLVNLDQSIDHGAGKIIDRIDPIPKQVYFFIKNSSQLSASDIFSKVLGQYPVTSLATSRRDPAKRGLRLNSSPHSVKDLKSSNAQELNEDPSASR